MTTVKDARFKKVIGTAEFLKKENSINALMHILAELNVFPYDDEVELDKCLQFSLNEIHRYIRRVCKIEQ